MGRRSARVDEAPRREAVEEPHPKAYNARQAHGQGPVATASAWRNSSSDQAPPRVRQPLPQGGLQGWSQACCCAGRHCSHSQHLHCSCCAPQHQPPQQEASTLSGAASSSSTLAKQTDNSDRRGSKKRQHGASSPDFNADNHHTFHLSKLQQEPAGRQQALGDT